jgi:hypothetical protein
VIQQQSDLNQIHFHQSDLNQPCEFDSNLIVKGVTKFQKKPAAMIAHQT